MQVVCKYCYATGTVTGGGFLGGFVGVNSSYVSECFATGAVTGTDCIAGGFAGKIEGKTRDCYARGDVTVTGIIPPES
jgi:hypothetical protein